MQIKGIDVSSYQGKPDWEKVKKAGKNFAILRIHQKNGPDSSFEYNYKGCKTNAIPTGGYKYSYALTEAQALEEAEKTLAVLAGRELVFPVFYDLEWEKQRKLGKAAIEKIAETFLDRIRKAGYKAGIYCNMDWYQNVLTADLKKYDLWLARYPYKDDGTIKNSLRPTQGVGWQYSSKGKVDGIRGYVDMDVFYKDYADEINEEEKPAQPDRTPKWVGMVNVAKLNVRSGPGTEYPVLEQYPYLAQHNLIDVCDTVKASDGTDWYYVRIVSKYYGFVAARYITRI